MVRGKHGIVRCARQNEMKREGQYDLPVHDLVKVGLVGGGRRTGAAVGRVHGDAVAEFTDAQNCRERTFATVV